MKKKIVLFVFIQLLIYPVCFSQKLPKNVPDEIKAKCEVLKQTIKLKLDSCRTNRNIGSWKPSLLSFYLLYEGTLMMRDKEKEDELYPLQLDWKMVYDDAMIKRIVQLLKNEYEKEELELLVNRQMAFSEKYSLYEKNSIWQIKLDSAKIFKHVQDSLNKYRDKTIHPELYQYDEVGLYLKWDTIPRFHFLVDSFRIEDKKNTIDYFLNQIHFGNIRDLIVVCGYLNDKRFINPLINIAEHPETLGIEAKSDIKAYASVALARMQAEPYYSDYLKKSTFPLEEIKKKEFVVMIDFLSNGLHTQEAYLELSKYLHSSSPTRAYYSEDEHGGIRQAGKAYEDAFKEIQNNIENKDLQIIIHAPDFDLEKDRFKIYDWMQKNQGKYKIKRIW
jgi:hypothetical protein